MPRPTNFISEKVKLAIISVLGTVIVAIISQGGFKCKPDPDPNPIPISLKGKAGEVNEIVVYKNYNDILPLLSEPIKPILTREKFYSVADTVKFRIGDFIKVIDTTQNKINGNTFYYVKNQHQNGQSLTTVSFDENTKIIALYYFNLP